MDARKVAQVHVRSQHSVGSSFGRFGGPDTYVALTIAPEGVVVPKALDHRVLRQRGITYRYIGEGYREHDGPRSALGRAIAEATAEANRINAQ